MHVFDSAGRRMGQPAVRPPRGHVFFRGPIIPGVHKDCKTTIKTPFPERRQKNF